MRQAETSCYFLSKTEAWSKRGRLCTGAAGHAYVRPRMHPDEPRIGLPERARMDTTPFRIAVMGTETGAPRPGELASWRTPGTQFRHFKRDGHRMTLCSMPLRNGSTRGRKRTQDRQS